MYNEMFICYSFRDILYVTLLDNKRIKNTKSNIVITINLSHKNVLYLLSLVTL